MLEDVQDRFDDRQLPVSEVGIGGIRYPVAVWDRVPVTSVCPCSKAISDYGAHNQRGHITLQVQPRDEGGAPVTVWLEDLIEIAEASASSPVFPLLKRPDERYVTMRAHDNPVFVEDMPRAAACALSDDGRMAWFSVEAANDESVHNHAALARIDSRYLPGPPDE
jgi:GTP cyclohydrolase IB